MALKRFYNKYCALCGAKQEGKQLGCGQVGWQDCLCTDKTVTDPPRVVSVADIYDNEKDVKHRGLLT